MMNTEPSVALSDAALTYARSGWFIIPLKPGSKSPLTPHGVYDATTDEQQIQRWWSAQPNANIGLACGASGVVVIDIDPRNGAPADISAILEVLQIPVQEPVLISQTGGNGYHLFFRLPSAEEQSIIEISRRGLPPGVDIKSENGYVVLPPSIHPNGQLYRWVNATQPRPVSQLPEVPAHLLNIKSAGKLTVQPVVVASDKDHLTQLAQQRLTEEIEMLQRAQVGHRNDTLNAVTYRLGQWVGADLLPRQSVVDQIMQAAAHIGLMRDEPAKTLECVERAMADGINAAVKVLFT